MENDAGSGQVNQFEVGDIVFDGLNYYAVIVIHPQEAYQYRVVSIGYNYPGSPGSRLFFERRTSLSYASKLSSPPANIQKNYDAWKMIKVLNR